MDSDSSNVSKRSPTIRDSSGIFETIRDQDLRVADGETPDSYRRVSLPRELEEQYEVIREMPGGAEAVVLLVVERSTNDKRVIKLYGSNIVPDEETMRLLESANPEYVVQFEIGALGNFWYEIQEYCEPGTLRDYVTRRGGQLREESSLNVVIAEISSALSHIHDDLSITHRDIKPENIFVRCEEPLDLVLGDFGIARSISSVRFTRAWGTPAYWPPESASGQLSEVSPAWDWWSLGIIIYEISQGRHPLEDLQAAPQLIANFLINNSVSVDDVRDDRLRMLLRGLLVKNRAERWSGPEVKQWLEGGSPALPNAVVRSPARTVHFGGVDYASAATLAIAFQNSWIEARGALFQVRDSRLIDETKALCRSEELAEAVLILDQPLGSTEVARSFARLLIEMNAELPAVYNGVDLTSNGLLAASSIATSSVGTDPISQVIEELSTLEVLIVWRSLSGVSQGPEVNGKWLKKIGDFKSHLGTLERGTGNAIDSDLLSRTGVSLSMTETRAAYAWLLISVLQPATANETLGGLIDKREKDVAQQAPWWNNLDQSRQDSSALVLAMFSMDKAVQQVNSQRDLDRQRRVQRETEIEAQKSRELEQKRREEEVHKEAVRERFRVYSGNTNTWAFIGFFLWFIFYVGSIVSIVCLVRCIICRKECSRAGIKSPRENVKAFFWSIAPMIIFPTVVIIGLHTIHGFA